MLLQVATTSLVGLVIEVCLTLIELSTLDMYVESSNILKLNTVPTLGWGLSFVEYAYIFPFLLYLLL